MSSGGGTPRKFSEKIAIMERKQNEDVNQFEDIMREVRSITTITPGADPNNLQGMPIQAPGGLHPGQWPQLGGSLPNVHQLPSYQQHQQQMIDPWSAPHPSWGPIPGPGYPTPPHMMRGAVPPPVGPAGHRSRSPEQHASHYHPYGGRGQRSPDRVPPLHPYYPTNYPQAPPSHGLLPPDHWTQINRARSDPAIHHGQVPYPMVNPPHCMPGPSTMPSYGPPGSIPTSMGPPQGMPNQGGMPQQQGSISTSPLQSPMAHMSLQSYGYPTNGGSPTMQSPMGSPLGSSLMLDERTTPMMELSPPGLHEPNTAGSLPNLQQVQSNNPPTYYHQTVGQRHSTGACGPRLVPGPMLTPESQSAPTSPHNNLDPNQQPQWPATRTYSNSPESLDIPKVVLTNPEGALGQHLECFNDLHDLTLDANDMNMLCNGSSSNAVDPVHEPQLLN